MKSKKLASKKISKSSQSFLDIAEVKEDTVILKDGTIRAVLLVSSINFSLKSEDEQNAIISSYISFLNFLEYPLQIVIQSRKLDVDGYLNRLKKIEKEQTNELLRMQTTDYRQYVSELVEMGDIMNKRFYIVVPYDPLSDKQKSWMKRFFGVFSAAKKVKLSQNVFTKRRHDLFQRVEHVISGLASMSVKSVVLDTQSLIELYYNTYNPDVYNQEKLVEINKLRVEE
ncbi:MAG: hypothetical protein CMI53_02150 [Parcubacteria group bacterium]|nr:hypothetical protein [Parcubacteria group bacterium]|tara:strand:- start:389 stop:1069 length:681 start_codon:yes stop_codon:yes gene_type:complete